MKKKLYEKVNELSILNTQLELEVMRNHRAKEAIEKVEAEMERLKQARRTVDRDMDIGQAPSVPTNSQKVSIGAMVTGQTVNQWREPQVLREENEALEAKFRELEKDLEIIMGMRLKLQGECAYLQGKFKSRKDTKYMKEVEISRVKLRITEEATKNRILEEELQNKNKELHRVKDYMTITQHAKRTVEENEVHGQKQQNCSEQVRRGEVQLDRVVGRGAYGEVWKGKLRGIKVAVKKPRENSSECRNLFEQEVTILFQLRHPNVVKCIGKIDDDDGLPCIVLEYADGTLGELLKERPLTHLEVFSFGLDAGRGLLYLHTRRPVPILHRDLHPGNLLFFLIAKLPGRMLKLCDFGTANFLRKTMTPDQGTPWLNAPEAKTQHYTTKADVYSFGLLLLMLIIRVWPKSENLTCQVQKVFDTSLQELIKECTAQNPELRPDMRKVVYKLMRMKSGAVRAHLRNREEKYKVTENKLQ